MPVTALVATLVFGALAFGARSVLHYRATGSTGFRGFSGAVGSAEWFGGVLFALSCVLVLAAPLCDLTGLLPRLPVIDGPTTRIAGLFVFGVGLVGTLWAQLAMGTSWRIGVDPSERTALVRRGPFQLVRNPIFTAMTAAVLGLALLVPNACGIGAVVALLVGLELHVRLVEEPYLARVHGDAYRRYAASTGRFLPGLGLGVSRSAGVSAAAPG